MEQFGYSGMVLRKSSYTAACLYKLMIKAISLVTAYWVRRYMVKDCRTFTNQGVRRQMVLQRWTAQMGLCHVCVVVCTAIWLSVDFTSAQATQECTWEKKAGMAGAQTEVAFSTITAGFLACQQRCEKDARCTAINYYPNLRCEIFYKVPQLFAETTVFYSVRICRTLTPVPTTQAQVVTTQAAVVTTQAPVPTTQAQIVTTQAAIVTTQAPVAATETAEVKTQADVVTTQAPAAATETAGVKRQAKVVTTQAPAAATQAPEPTSPVPDNMLCTIAGGPHVSAWDNSTSSIDLPCWYYVTDFTSGQCRIVVKALNEFEKDGSLFVSAVLVEFSAVRKDASANIGTSPGPSFKISRSITEQARRSNPWSGLETNTIEGVEIRKMWDAQNGFAILDFPSCGARITFRPHVPHVGQHPQVQLPGMTISAPKNASFSTQNTNYMCQVPDSDPKKQKTLHILNKHTKFANRDTATIHLILSTHGKIQGDGNCAALESIMTNCSSRQQFATEYCGPILTDLNIRKCILSKNQSPPEYYFGYCLKWACTCEVNACHKYSAYAARPCNLPPLMVTVQCDVNRLNEEAKKF